jgi:UDP-N-acetylglucosamine--N-acetylmuramyl-(pentapeptide) pyrophosphoryl-undecaprenol N-acetylglucosamine transferase
MTKIFLATGGSGGHIFPAISVVEKLIEKKNTSICIISDDVYNKYASSYNYNYKIIRASKKFKSFSGLKDIFFGFLQSRALIKKEKPDLVIGFGSYATFPMLLACVLCKTKFLLHEQNAYIGKVNKIFGKYAESIMVSYPEIYGIPYESMKKIVYTGAPIRKSIRDLYNLEYSLPKEDETFNVLITGGSAGANIFSQYLPKIFDRKHVAEQKKLKIYHQVREEFIDEVKKYYKKLNLNCEVSPFFKDMDELLSKCHLIIGRAGNGTVVETAIAGIPAIFIPLKTSKSNRQEDNAKYVEKVGGAIMVLEKDFNIEGFQNIFFNLLKDKNKLENMAKNIKKVAVIDADEKISNIIKNILNV